MIESDDATTGGVSLPTPQQAIEALEGVARPHTVAPLSAQRLLKLATNCSQRAAVSSRLELYPQKMAAQRAIRIAMGSLIGPRVLTEAQVRERILGRYPEAEDLPPRPALDGMLTEAGSDLVWRQDGADGPGYYPSHKGFGPSAGTTTFLHRTGTFADDKNEVTEEEVSVGDMVLHLRTLLGQSKRDKPLFILQVMEQQRTRRAMICIFLAVLEMVKMQAVEILQKDLFGEIALAKGERFSDDLTQPVTDLEEEYK